MHAGKLALRAVVLAASLVWVQAASAQGAENLDNATCLGCHGVSGFAAPRADGQTRSLFVSGGSICRQRARQGAALRRLPYDNNRAAAQDRVEDSRRVGADAARHRQELHRLPCQGRAGLHGDLSRPGRRHGFCPWRDLRRLPRQPRDLARQQSGIERGAGQSAEHLPQVPCATRRRASRRSSRMPPPTTSRIIPTLGLLRNS